MQLLQHNIPKIAAQLPFSLVACVAGVGFRGVGFSRGKRPEFGKREEFTNPLPTTMFPILLPLRLNLHNLNLGVRA